MGCLSFQARKQDASVGYMKQVFCALQDGRSGSSDGPKSPLKLFFLVTPMCQLVSRSYDVYLSPSELVLAASIGVVEMG